ncbi:Fc receptor-like protein 3 [Choloepus didactylus]|uniref:Fc receptor-like protein 3 n=1 Tax=Choloepus didactylus TaxID=27675 RepID=UPI0018A0F939|nr:Fc receptor-like protein 3 [Choloepus didactylus]
MLLRLLLVMFALDSGQSRWLTLLAPSSVFEGDTVVLRCQSEDNKKIITMSYYKDGREFFFSKRVSNFPIPNAGLSDSGQYYCTASGKNIFHSWKETSNTVNIKVQELFPQPVLRANPSRPTEGRPVTLTCETQLPPQRPHAQLQFCFFKDGQVLGPGWSRSPELQMPTRWSKDLVSYWCKAVAVIQKVRKQSLPSQIHVQRVPVSNISLEAQAPGGQVIEGGKLILICSVAGGTGNITFSWHKEATGTSVGQKTLHSLSAELKLLAVKESDAGDYYCRADNGLDPIRSNVLNVPVKVPVSRPVLTLRAPRAEAVVGDVVELHCEAQRGSPPILYWFYHEDVTLENSSALSGGGASFNLSLTAEHSGNYSCEANNGLGAQHSEAVPLNITGSDGYRRGLVKARVLGGLFSVLSSIAVALLFYCWFHKISGRRSATNAPRGPTNPGLQEGTHPNVLTEVEEQQPEYVNMDPVGVNVIYSQVWSLQQSRDSANTERMFLENKPSGFFSWVSSMRSSSCTLTSVFAEVSQQARLHLSANEGTALGNSEALQAGVSVAASGVGDVQSAHVVVAAHHLAVGVFHGRQVRITEGAAHPLLHQRALAHSGEADHHLAEVFAPPLGHETADKKQNSVPAISPVCFCSIFNAGAHGELTRKTPSCKARPFSVLLPPPMYLHCSAFCSGAAPKAVLLLDPPWSPLFKEEKMTLTCRGSHIPAQGDTSWYYESLLLEADSEMIQTNLPGNYQCETQGSSLSDAVHVGFSSDWLILQASHPVFEGDTVNLRCKGKEEKKIIEKMYYKDGKELQIYKNSDFNSDFITVKPWDNGEYYCTASGQGFLRLWTETSKPLRIQVQELFPHPVLIASPYRPTEGTLVTLKCETWLPPTKSDIKLRFCFFRGYQALEPGWSRSPELQIPTIWSEDSRSYWCEAEAVTPGIRKRSQSSQIYVQRIPVSDVNLEIQPPGGQVVEGENLVLVCSVANGTGTVTFSWYREGTEGSLGRKSQRSLSAELQVPNVKERDSGRYYCAAYNIYSSIYSKKIEVTVRIPVSRPVLTLRVPGAQAVVGDVVEVHCEVKRGSPPILYQFYHEDVILGNSSAPSGRAESFNLSLTAEHSGNYSCEANNGLGAQHSEVVPLSVIVPVSRPVLTLRTPRAHAMVGDVVELHCGAQRGSPPILYQFYNEDVPLGNSSAPSGEGASFNLSLTTEHSGNYSCEATNGLGVQRSEMLPIIVTGLPGSRTGPIAAGVTGGLLSILGLATAAALLSRLRTHKQPGGIFAPGTPSPQEFQEPSLVRTSNTNAYEPSCSETPFLVELQPVYSNVNPEENNLVYSQILSIQHTREDSANSSRMHQKDKESPVIYAELKKAYPDDSTGEASSMDRDHEDSAENYENVP